MKWFVLFYSAALIGFSSQVFSGKYVVGVEALSYYPLYQGDGNSFRGYARELLDEFGKSKGHRFTYRAVPVKRLYFEFLTNKIDFKYPDNLKWAHSIKQDQNIYYSDSTIESIDGIMSLRGNYLLNIDNFTKIGTLRGFTAWVYMDDISKGTTKLSEVNDMKTLISMVKFGRIQGAYLNVMVAQYYMKHTLKDPGMLTFNVALPHARDHFSLSTIKYPGVIKEFNEFLKDNKVLVDNLKSKYQVKLSFPHQEPKLKIEN